MSPLGERVDHWSNARAYRRAAGWRGLCDEGCKGRDGQARPRTARS